MSKILNPTDGFTAAVGATNVDTTQKFTAVGTGAVTRTSLERGQDWISVKDFGAVGDSATDNSTAIQNAHDSLPASGGTLFVPRSSAAYRITSELVFTKPVQIVGDGADASILEVATNASNKDAISTTKSLTVRGMQIRTVTAPTSDLGMKAINFDVPAAGGHRVLIEQCKIYDFNFGVFADGRTASIDKQWLDEVLVRDCDIRINSAVGAVAEPIFIGGALVAKVENNTCNNQGKGDHNVYAQFCAQLEITNNRLLNANNEGIKAVTQGSSQTGTLAGWHIKNNYINNCNRAMVIQPTGSVVLLTCELAGNTVNDCNSTSAGDEAAIYIGPADTSIIRNLAISGSMHDIQLHGISVSCATGAEISNVTVGGLTVRDFSKASSGTYSALSFGSLGTVRKLTVSGMFVDGNSTGRAALSLSSALAQHDVFGLREVNCGTPNTGAMYLSGALVLKDGLTAPASNITGYAQIYIDAADGDLKIRFSDGTVKTIVVDT